MQYTLITSKGKVYTFFIKAVAETYLLAFGGNLITADILTVPAIIAELVVQ